MLHNITLYAFAGIQSLGDNYLSGIRPDFTHAIENCRNLTLSLDDGGIAAQLQNLAHDHDVAADKAVDDPT